MQLYTLLYLIVLVSELLAVQDGCSRYQRYWVKPTDSDCKCANASINTIWSSTTDDVTYRCDTMNEYAKCLTDHGTCNKNNIMLMKAKCIMFLFLPGVHNLIYDLYISNRVSLMMIKEPKCSGKVEIYLNNEASITLSYIAQLTLANFSIINGNPESQNSLTLLNVSRASIKYSMQPPPIMHVNNIYKSVGNCPSI